MTSNCKVAGLTTIIISLLCFPAPAAAQSEQEKIGAAKKEGAVYWYGSMNVDDASALIAGIHKKYPFIEIKRFRAANAPVLSKLDVEARARALNVRAGRLSERNQRSGGALVGLLHFAAGRNLQHEPGPAGERAQEL